MMCLIKSDLFLYYALSLKETMKAKLCSVMISEKLLTEIEIESVSSSLYDIIYNTLIITTDKYYYHIL